jgi:gas vesicle protein
MIATVAGALVGAAAAYLFFTDHGRRVRRSFEPALEDLAQELASFRVTVRRALGVAGDGWGLLTDTLDDAAVQLRKYPPHQSSPF